MNLKDKIRMHVHSIKEFPIGVGGKINEKYYVVEASIFTDTIQGYGHSIGSNIPTHRIAEAESRIEIVLTEDEYAEFVKTHDRGMWRRK